MTAPTYQLSLVPSIDPAKRAALVAALAKIAKSPTRRARRARAGRTMADRGAAVLAAADAGPVPARPWYVLIEYRSQGGEKLAFVAGPLSCAAAQSLASEHCRTSSMALGAKAYRAGAPAYTPNRIVVLPSQQAEQVVRLPDSADTVSNSNATDAARVAA